MQLGRFDRMASAVGSCGVEDILPCKTLSIVLKARILNVVSFRDAKN